MSESKSSRFMHDCFGYIAAREKQGKEPEDCSIIQG